jgi:hypothetical protein
MVTSSGCSRYTVPGDASRSRSRSSAASTAAWIQPIPARGVEGKQNARTDKCVMGERRGVYDAGVNVVSDAGACARSSYELPPRSQSRSAAASNRDRSTIGLAGRSGECSRWRGSHAGVSRGCSLRLSLDGAAHPNCLPARLENEDEILDFAARLARRPRGGEGQSMPDRREIPRPSYATTPPCHEPALAPQPETLEHALWWARRMGQDVERARTRWFEIERRRTEAAGIGDTGAQDPLGGETEHAGP